ncbi:hypothetical protein GCM10017771_03510 [Streptomyces capitiformicae]|uniref:Uncharacterized protein n=1 Tax=Streptomyces capitiformicae TaxID=2014920 RepID=A0A919GCK2_9ACTN|nr:hypothetical protein GCM10017771_03510 [Streptomyces capitiformicae]
MEVVPRIQSAEETVTQGRAPHGLARRRELPGQIGELAQPAQPPPAADSSPRTHSRYGNRSRSGAAAGDATTRPTPAPSISAGSRPLGSRGHSPTGRSSTMPQMTPGTTEGRPGSARA